MTRSRHRLNTTRVGYGTIRLTYTAALAPGGVFAVCPLLSFLVLPWSLLSSASSLALRPSSLAPLGPFTLTLTPSLCIPKWILPSTNVGLCCYLFYVSKYVELLDTAFLLLRNKPVRFVQKWHHVSVLYLFWSYMQVRERELVTILSHAITSYTIRHTRDNPIATIHPTTRLRR